AVVLLRADGAEAVRQRVRDRPVQMRKPSFCRMENVVGGLASTSPGMIDSMTSARSDVTIVAVELAVVVGRARPGESGSAPRPGSYCAAASSLRRMQSRSSSAMSACLAKADIGVG